jgi:DNA topoisomerase-1
VIVRSFERVTWIEELERRGHRRLGTPQRGFRWVDAAGRPLPAREAERLQALKLPPAWTHVRAHPSPRARLQAIGQDARGRVQYRYHPAFRARQDAAKFRRLTDFAQSLPGMRAAVARDLARPGLPREKVLACILRILSTCFLRPGSDVYASENGTYGIATLRPEHVKVRGDTVSFRFTGKAGKWQERAITDRRVAQTIRELLRLRNEEVFAFVDEGGSVVDVKRQHINRYVKEVMGERFSAKDFRTWAGTLTCATALARAGVDPDDGPRTLRRKVTEAIRETSEVLGNTPAVCRSSYVWPGVITAFGAGRVLESAGTAAAQERALLALLDRRERPLEGALRASVRQAARVRRKRPARKR